MDGNITYRIRAKYKRILCVYTRARSRTAIISLYAKIIPRLDEVPVAVDEFNINLSASPVYYYCINTFCAVTIVFYD